MAICDRERCDICHGSGHVRYIQFKTETIGYRHTTINPGEQKSGVTVETALCPKCDGKGMVKK